ncbi:beta-galactosidase [Hungatella effluvii]|uniref:beta-galactosidase n=1 Tax=Hungatella effluvii TaxID=1096246 RepID=UPI002A7FAB4B|nr:beta-galactosidase [Hungatella effluvii]
MEVQDVYFGALYYRPPFPDRTCWERDFLNMKQLGFHVVKLWAVWNDIEREPDHFVFDDLDRLTELAGKNGLKVIINTIPEGAPYWLYEAYPDCLYETVEGKKITMGGPANLPTGGWPGLCMDNPEVSDLVCNFIFRTAEHYRDNSSVIILDVWNEPHLEPMFDYKNELLCACGASKRAFRDWLKVRYGSLERLNEAWFRRYSDWEEIVPPPRFGTYTDMMDWRRFWLYNLAEWLKRRVEAARRGAPGKLIQTHSASADYMGASSNGALGIELSDEFLLAREVDVFGLSSFPKWLMGETKRDYDLSHLLQSEIICAASREKVFYQAELQGGAGVPGFLAHKVPKREDIRIWNWNTIAAGGKGVVYWQYAPEPAGMESPGFGLTGFNGENTERSLEAGRCAKLFEAYELDRSRPVPAINGIYLSRNADLLLFAAGAQEEKYAHSIYGVFKSCTEGGIPVRFVHGDYMESAWEEGLRVLYVPMSLSLSDEEQSRILEFAGMGGRVVLEAAAGLYSEMGEISAGGSSSPCPMLEAAFGAEEISLDAGDGEIPVLDKVGAVLCEGLYYRQTMKAARGKVTGWFEDGTPAMAEVEYGKGVIRWTGTFPGAAVKDAGSRAAAEFIQKQFKAEGYSLFSVLEAPELIVRLLQTENGPVMAVVNQTPESRPLFTRERTGKEWSLEVPGYDGVLLILETGEQP